MNTEGFHKLEDDVIRFRAMEMEDAKTIHEYASNPDVKKFIGWPLSITMEDTNELVSGMIGKEAAGTHLYATVIAKDTDQIVGTVMVFNFNKAAKSTSTLFTGHSGPTLESELSREIRTSDEIDFLVSFIKFSGLRLIYDDLVAFTKTNKLRVITTSYMGASDYKAIVELAKLPNTEVKVSYDNKRTRLHAKAYCFKRKTGFSTAYIGSSNISNPALSNGLEWNLKVSEYTSKDVVDSFGKTFESYWNDEEFKNFDPESTLDKEELKRSLNKERVEETPYLFFDLNPYSHQKEILEDLKLEREEYGSYKNLVVAATGERVIIVTGCINVLVSRVSGTLTKYNSCIA